MPYSAGRRWTRGRTDDDGHCSAWRGRRPQQAREQSDVERVMLSRSRQPTSLSTQWFNETTTPRPIGHHSVDVCYTVGVEANFIGLLVSIVNTIAKHVMVVIIECRWIFQRLFFAFQSISNRSLFILGNAEVDNERRRCRPGSPATGGVTGDGWGTYWRAPEFPAKLTRTALVKGLRWVRFPCIPLPPGSSVTDVGRRVGPTVICWCNWLHGLSVRFGRSMRVGLDWVWWLLWEWTGMRWQWSGSKVAWEG